VRCAGLLQLAAGPIRNPLGIPEMGARRGARTSQVDHGAPVGRHGVRVVEAVQMGSAVDRDERIEAGARLERRTRILAVDGPPTVEVVHLGVQVAVVVVAGGDRRPQVDGGAGQADGPGRKRIGRAEEIDGLDARRHGRRRGTEQDEGEERHHQRRQKHFQSPHSYSFLELKCEAQRHASLQGTTTYIIYPILTFVKC
jgi:hypothetical protein